MFWPCVLLGFSLMCVKLSYAPLSMYWRDATLSSALQWLAAISAQDLLFGLGTVLLAFLPRRVFIAFGCLCVAYAVAAREIFAYYGAPLTSQMILLAAQGDPTLVWSWVSPYATGWAWLSLAFLPALYFLAVKAASRLGVRAKLGAALACLLWLGLGCLRQPEDWFLHQDRFIPESPHWTLMTSFFGRRNALSSAEFPEEYLRDFAPSHGEGAYKGKRPRNVVLVVLETAGTRYLSPDVAPRLAAETRNALLFENYYCEVPWTAHALFSMMMSLRPPLLRYRIVPFGMPLAAGTTLAQAFKSRGYRTAFLSSGDPSWATPGFREESGFDMVRERITDDKSLFQEGLRWAERESDRPFFMVLWTDQNHSPCRLVHGEMLPELPSGAQVREREWLRLYLSVLKEVDGYVGGFFDALRARGLAKDTLVAVVGDHGEGFRDGRDNAGHGFSLYEEETHVPLILWNAGKGRSSAIGSHMDLGPTLLDVMGFPIPPGWQGASLFSPDRSPRVYLYAAAWGRYLLGVREKDWKYIADARRGTQELYDLSKDPEERVDLHESQPERCREFRRRLAAFLGYSRRPNP